MQCRSCGTEIADKAIVCFRCGAATTDPVRKAVPVRSGSPLVSFVVAGVLVLIALYIGAMADTVVDPAQRQTIAGVLAGAAVIVVSLGLLRRRRRR